MKTVKAAIAARCRSVALAGVIVVLASYLNPSNAFGQATSVTSYGFRANEGGGGALSTGWVTGNLGNTWAEGEWVPYQLVIDNVQTGYPNLTDFPDIIMSYDFTTADARFVDLVRSIQVGTQQLTDLQGWVNNDGTAYPMGTRAQIEAAQNDVGNVAPLDNVWTLGGGGNFALLNLPNSQVNRDLAGNVGTPTDAERTFRITRADLIAAGVPLTANRIVIYYQLHESRSFVWANSLQEQYDQSPTDDWGGYIYSLAAFAADARNGAGFVPGSSGHIEVEFAGGKKSVPIPIPEQLPGAVSGIKWHDANGNCVIDQGEPTLSGWQVCVSGTLEGIEFEDCDTTDVDGAYSFPNLTSGGSGWLICEAENRTTPAESGYMQTCPTLATAPVGVGAPAACSPPFAAVGWLVNLTVANANQPNMNFGNKRCEVACSGPSDVTIDCSESTDPSNTGIPVITGNCPPIDTSYTDSTTAGNCAAEYVITRTWIITDVGGMKDTCVQFITVVDTTAPVITCQDNKTIDCAEAVVFDEPSATDDCSEVTITILSTIGSAGDCPAESSFTRTWEAMDACGNADTCSQTVARQDTTRPECSIPADTSIFQCDPAEVCLAVSATDNCDESVTCEITDGPGTLLDGRWCYTPSGDETVTVTIRCTDDCGNFCEESFSVTFSINEPPSCDITGGLTPPICILGPQLITFTVTDPDGDSLVCTNTNPGATLTEGLWSYTPQAGETVYDTIICADVPCGEACTMYVFITFPNPEPPLCQVPEDTTIYLCNPEPVCLPVSALNGSCSITSGPGEYIDSMWCFTPEQSDTLTIGVECVGLCDTCRDSFTVVFILNEPPVIECQTDSLSASAGSTVTLDIPISDPDDSVLTVSIIGITLDGSDATPDSMPTIDSTGHFEWVADPTNGVWCFLIEVADECEADTCQICIEVTSSDEFCSLTQGAYGNPNGTFNGVVRTTLVYNLLETPLVIGKPGRSVTFGQEDFLCIIQRLPAGGGAVALPATLGDAALDSATCQTNPALPLDKKGEKFKNVLLGQTITLSLNVRLDTGLADFGLCRVFQTHDALPGPDGLLGTEDDILNPGPDSTLGTIDDPIGTFYISSTVLQALTNLGLPQTVAGLLELANRGLAGLPTGGASLSQINTSVDAINRGFDECRFLVFCGDALPGPTLTSQSSLSKQVPASYLLEQNYPNPFNASTVISYALDVEGQVDLAVYNVLGQRVMTLVDEYQAPGTYSAVWLGTDEDGNTMASGVYFYRLQLGNEIQTRKMVLLK